MLENFINGKQNKVIMAMVFVILIKVIILIKSEDVYLGCYANFSGNVTLLTLYDLCILNQEKPDLFSKIEFQYK